jgi:hypothetical protein
VCRNDQLRAKVNDLLTFGASYAMIVRSLEDDNAKLNARDRVTIDSIRNHTARHFPVQQTARATYREILERRAKENAVDFVNGVATAITPMAFFETVVARAYQTLVDEGTIVSVDQGIHAARQLHELTHQDAGVERMAHMQAELNRIVNAFRELPPEYQEFVLAKLDSRSAPPPPTGRLAVIEATPGDDVEFDPFDNDDEEDDEDD